MFEAIANFNVRLAMSSVAALPRPAFSPSGFAST
jgi:hypothetical protein